MTERGVAGAIASATFLALASTLASRAAPAQAPPPPRAAPATLVWDARAVEHLYNRAGFGARPDEIEAGVALGQAAVVAQLVAKRVDVEPFFCERIDVPDPRVRRDLTPEALQMEQRAFREKDRRQLQDYTAWWLERMASGEDPLRERMTLFWHGFFTSSYEEVNRGWLLVRQNQLVREKAIGSYADLLLAMTRDPAMLVYLDNTSNRKGNPNENFARELMELFSLGVGNFAESDVKEAARALTGRGISREGSYEFHPRLHDGGKKTVLGATGKLDGEGLVALLLKQEACPRWVAGRLITYFEGVPPSAERLADYAAFLRRNGFEIQPFLQRLFLDPAFYRDEVVGARVQGPVEFMVGLSRRLGTRVPPVVLGGGATLLGQRLFFPPSVKGWEEGEPWITTASLMQRGNLAGFVLGMVKVDDVLSESDVETSMAEDPTMGPREPGAMEAEKPKGGRKAGSRALDALRRVEAAGWSPSIHFSARMLKAGARTDAEIANAMLDGLLGIRAREDTRERMRGFLERERADLKAEDGKLLEQGAAAEHLLRRLAHLILSLPEAQLE